MASGDFLLEDGVGAVGLLAQHLEGALIAQNADDLAAPGRLNDRDLGFRFGQKITTLGHRLTSHVLVIPELRPHARPGYARGEDYGGGRGERRRLPFFGGVGSPSRARAAVASSSTSLA
jgi:hypothetical protein